jgi:hypothetical protein
LAVPVLGALPGPDGTEDELNLVSSGVTPKAFPKVADDTLLDGAGFEPVDSKALSLAPLDPKASPSALGRPAEEMPLLALVAVAALALMSESAAVPFDPDCDADADCAGAPKEKFGIAVLARVGTADKGADEGDLEVSTEEGAPNPNVGGAGLLLSPLFTDFEAAAERGAAPNENPLKAVPLPAAEGGVIVVLAADTLLVSVVGAVGAVDTAGAGVGCAPNDKPVGSAEGAPNVRGVLAELVEVDVAGTGAAGTDADPDADTDTDADGAVDGCACACRGKLNPNPAAAPAVLSLRPPWNAMPVPSRVFLIAD